MLRGLFVTGTDTRIGKTMVSAALMQRFRGQAPVRYWKPIQTGIEHDNDTKEVSRLGSCSTSEILSMGLRLARPLSPHLSARLAGQPIEIAPLLEIIAAQPPSNRWIVEGAGGVLVPLNDHAMMIDLIAALGLPTVVVARARLGTINHTLLTIEALRARALTVAGVVMVGKPNADNREAIERYGGVRVAGELPKLEPLTPASLRRWAVAELDRDDHLATFLQ
jgi:dethiobiotin synthase